MTISNARVIQEHGQIVYIFGSFCDRIIYVFLYYRVDDYFRVFLGVDRLD
jgi:hypothetical protein